MEIDISGQIDIPRSAEGAIDMQSLNADVGEGVAEALRIHFDRLDAERPNKLGGKRTHYWGQARDSVHSEPTDTGAVVDVTQIGVRLHFYGGTVTPGKGISFVTGRQTRMLTIPADASAHGRRAAEFQNLEVLWGKNGPFALALAQGGGKIRGINKPVSDKPKAKTGVVHAFAGVDGMQRRIMFWLVKSATIKPDKSVLPTDEAIEKAGLEAAKENVAAQISAWLDRGKKGGDHG